MGLRSKKSIYLFRHGETSWNAEGRIQGHHDIPLNDRGREQARRIVTPIRKLKVEAILTSDLSRAVETARIVAEPSAIPVFQEKRLREVHFGKLEGLDRAQIEAKFGKSFSDGLRDHPMRDEHVAILGCESTEQVRTRANAGIREFFENQDHLDRIAISCHGGVIRRILQHAEGIEGFPPAIPNSAIFPLILDLQSGRWRFLGFLPFS